MKVLSRPFTRTVFQVSGSVVVLQRRMVRLLSISTSLISHFGLKPFGLVTLARCGRRHRDCVAGSGPRVNVTWNEKILYRDQTVADRQGIDRNWCWSTHVRKLDHRGGRDDPEAPPEAMEVACL